MKVRNALIVIVIAVVLAAGLGLGLTRSGDPSATAATGKRTDPLVTAQLYVDCDHLTGLVTALSGLEWSTEVVEHKVVDEGGVPVILKTPGAMSYTPMVLERGITGDTSFEDWARLVETGDNDEARSDMIIVLYDQSHREVARWHLVNCWPSKCTIGVDTRLVNNITQSRVMEYLTVEYEGFERVDAGYEIPS